LFCCRRLFLPPAARCCRKYRLSSNFREE
jgi:hypothetical protein